MSYIIYYPVPTKELQFLFNGRIDGNSIIQLKDGKLLSYYFEGLYYIYIYNEKTFKKLIEIDFYKSISEYEKEKLKKDNDQLEDINHKENDYMKRYNDNRNI